MPIDAIRVGERHRKDLGDVAALAASMAERLLHPVVVRPDGLLIAGERRLRAAQLLGWQTIPVTIIDLDDIVRGEFAENAHRKDFTLSEAVAIKRALEPLEKAAAKERQRQDRQGNRRYPAHAGEGRGRRRCRRSRAGKVWQAARRDGQDGARQRPLQAAQGRQAGREDSCRAATPARTRALSGRRSRFPVALRDRQRGVDDSRRVALPHDVHRRDTRVSGHLDHARGFDPLGVATNFHMQVIPELLRCWGYRHVTILTWAKDHVGAGDWLRGQTEHAVMAVRGKPVVTLASQTTLLHAPMREHSQKPVEFYDLVEGLCPAPRYCDLFSRYRHNERWDPHGDEAPVKPDHAAAPAAPRAQEIDDLRIPEFLRRAPA